MLPIDVSRIIASCETCEQLITSKKWVEYIYKHHEEHLREALGAINLRLLQLSGDIFDLSNAD